MSNEERPDSLADQAAAWIPPWQRPAPAPPTTPASPKDSAPPTDSPPPTDSAPPTASASVAVGDAADLGAQVPLQGRSPSKIEIVDELEGRGAGEGGTEEVAGVRAAEGDLGGDAPGGDVPGGDAPGADASGDLGGGRRRSGARVRPVPEPAPDLDDAELRGALEAILLVVDEPVSELVLAQVLEQPAERIGPMLDEIAAGFTAAGHGFELRRAAGGWRLYTRPEYATYVERFVLDGQSVRLTQAALETLAVVAYKQPVTRSRISAIRGVNCDGVIRTLVTRGLIEECGTESDSGAYLYRTSTMFLEKLGLNSLDDLPPLAPFLPDDVEELADATR
ncbi:SMC-Scp complex subunit ScpB [Micromonospora sp. C95]|uniref:SMC-Scp complex subunit ScpB n=1 Tax=Micromonospora sp. C95 TaxID=2824882 RepID=UPI001B36C260|nr:SMC-Scp complex subunit ScpB [Micromonospora sp. C95]MBQ1024783.1 SMC-Scp complex subunit ScpB [Micromonospora sp. C95]